MSLIDDIQKQQEQTLAPYAMKFSHSRGRRYKKPKNKYGTEFQRDRER